ncbi:MAG: hypothetical protein FJ086_10285 [Deltaproteobacteria bacterium]|nr:hypothetical protein [Deltaproteobacteria bacterium]
MDDWAAAKRGGGVNVREVPGGVRARWRRFGARVLPRVMAVAAWNGFLAGW